MTAEERLRLRVVGICIRDGRLLCTCATDDPDGPLGLPGGGLEPGVSMEDQLRQEFVEETTTTVATATYLFVVENRFELPGAGRLHQIEHYFEITLDVTDGADVASREPHLAFCWIPIATLGDADLRPRVVRDTIAEGRLHDRRHLIQPAS